MGRGNTLANVLLMVKAELGYNLTAGVATQQDQELYWRIENKQQWLASQFDWPFLDTTGDVALNAGQRVATLPDLNFERPVCAYAKWNERWHELQYGISVAEYNYLDSEASTPASCDPIQRWNTDDNTEFEVWPIPTTEHTVRFAGQRPLNPLKAGGSFNAALTLDLDDQLVVLFVAADLLMRQKNADAKLKLETAQNRLAYLRAAGPARTRMFALGSCDGERKIRRVVLVAGSGAGVGPGGELLIEGGGAVLLE